MLKLAKIVSFYFCTFVFYVAADHAFDPGVQPGYRARLAFACLLLAACASVFSGMIFIWPSPSNPQRESRLIATLPIRAFVGVSAVLLALFLVSWSVGDLGREPAPFLSAVNLPR